MKITEDNILEGLIFADVLLDLSPCHKNDLREICEQCVYLLYLNKI